MWTDRTSIQTKFMRNMISIALTSMGLWCLIWVHGEYSAFRTESELLRAEYTESQKKILKSEVTGVATYINFMKAQADKELQIGLKERVYEAHQIALNIYRENKESKTPAEIKKMVKDALRPIRFNSRRGYYFAVSMDGTEILYPVRPEFEGKNLIDLQDSKGNFVIQDEINIINKSGEGFVKHYWTKPDKDPAVLFPKISFVKHFKPLDWYFGTGEYLDDAQKQLQKEVLNRLAGLRFGTEGYFFGSTFRGESLFSNGKVTKGGGNIWDLTDPNGVKIIQEQRKAVKNPAGGFVSYVWKKLDAPIPSPKISYVVGIPEWQWTIGAGVYLDTIDNEISKRRKTLESGLRKKTINSIVILMALLLLIYFWSKRISKQLANAIDTFSLSLKKSTTEAVMVDPVDIHLREFKNIAVLTNKMLEDRKNAEGSLIESEKKYRNIVENTPDAIISVSSDGKVTSWNRGATQMFGFSANEILGKDIGLLTPGELNEQRKAMLEEVKRSGQIQGYETIRVSKDGTHIPVELNLNRRLDTQGASAGTFAIIRDITARKQAEVALRNSEEKYRLIVETQSDLVIKFDGKKRILYANPNYCQTFGKNAEELIGHTFTPFIHPDDVHSVDTSLASLVDKPHATYHEERAETLKGWRWFGWSAGAVLDDNGEIKEVVSVGRDITERKKAEADRDRLLAAIEQSSEIIIITDTDGNIQYANPIFEQITGYSREDAIGKNPRILKSGEQDEAFYRSMWQTINAGDTWHGRLINRKRDGTIYTEDASISPVADQTGRIVNFVAVKRDITNEIKMEERLRQSQKMESIGTLAGGIAHDFNNILFPIVGCTEMLLEDIPEDSPLRNNLNEVFKGALRAKELVKQILAFSRQDRHEIKLMRMQPVIKEALTLIRSTIPTSIEVKQYISNNCGPIKADPTQIHQVVINLATNAYHAMEDDGGELKIALKEIEFGEQDVLNPEMTPGPYACLTVSDTGIGIAEEVRGKIFDPYFTTKKQGKGTGIGLSVIHGIVYSSGGFIKVYSTPGKRTVFHVYLPVEISSSEQQVIQAKESIQGGTERILLVDDEEAIVFMEKQMLERMGYSVDLFTSSVGALEVFQANPDKFDLVISDMTMPNMNGDELASELVKIRPDIPVLLCTGFSERIPEEKANLMGIKGILMKPIVKRDLSAKIREVLDNTERSAYR